MCFCVEDGGSFTTLIRKARGESIGSQMGKLSYLTTEFKQNNQTKRQIPSQRCEVAALLSVPDSSWRKAAASSPVAKGESTHLLKI